MTLVKIGGMLKQRVKELGFGRQADALTILKLAEQYIAENFKGPIGKKLTPQSFKDGTLLIASSSASAASEIKIFEKDLLEYINRKIKEGGKVVKLRVLI